MKQEVIRMKKIIVVIAGIAAVVGVFSGMFVWREKK